MHCTLKLRAVCRNKNYHKGDCDKCKRCQECGWNEDVAIPRKNKLAKNDLRLDQVSGLWYLSVPTKIYNDWSANNGEG